MQNTIVNINGQIVPFGETGEANQAKVSVFDRSYLYGDSLYEVVRSYQGKFFFIEEHLQRLQKSAELCRMKLDQDISFYASEIKRSYQSFCALPGNEPSKDVYARLIVSRGVGKVGFDLKCLTTPSLFTIIMQPVEAPSAENYKKGIKLKIVTRLRNDRRALDPAMKSGNYLNSLLAYLEAAEERFDDAVLCNSEGHVTEGTTFNLFYIRRGILVTPPLDVGILEGITRAKILQLARQLNIPCREVRFPKERLYEADEIFLSGSVKELYAVTQIDTVKVGNGSQGRLTRKLHEHYRQLLV